jgi:hypothetical protein
MVLLLDGSPVIVHFPENATRANVTLVVNPAAPAGLSFEVVLAAIASETPMSLLSSEVVFGAGNATEIRIGPLGAIYSPASPWPALSGGVSSPAEALPSTKSVAKGPMPRYPSFDLVLPPTTVIWDCVGLFAPGAQLTLNSYASLTISSFQLLPRGAPTLRWQGSLSSAQWTPAIGSTGTTIFASSASSSHPMVQAMRGSDGSTKWSSAVLGSKCPVVLVNSTVVASVSKTAYHELDAETGQVLLTHDLGVPTGCPVVVDGGIVIFGTHTGLHAVRAGWCGQG